MLKKINLELTVLIVGRVLQVLTALIAIRLATNLLESSEMGNLYLILAIAGFFSTFMVSPVGQYINRKTHQWSDDSNIMNVYYLYNFYITALAILSFFVVKLLVNFSVGGGVDPFYFSFFIALYIYFNTWNQTIIPMINILGNRVGFVIFTLATQVLLLLLSYLSVVIFEAKGVFWFLGQVGSFGLLALIALLFFIKKIDSSFDIIRAHRMIKKESFLKVFRFSAPLSIGVLFLWLQNQSYGLIIERFLGSEFLGRFGVGMAVALAISSAFESILMQYFYPKMYKSMKDQIEFSKEISGILNLIIPIYFLLSIFVSFFSVYIMTILVDEKYFDSYIFAVLGVWIAFFKTSTNMIANIAHAQLKTGKLILPYAVGAFIAVIGVSFSCSLDNFEYAIPLSLILAGLLGFIVMFIQMNCLCKINFKVRNHYIVVFYSLPFTLSFLLSDYSSELIQSILILGVFGTYFLYVLYILVKRGGYVE